MYVFIYMYIFIYFHPENPTMIQNEKKKGMNVRKAKYTQK